MPKAAPFKPASLLFSPSEWLIVQTVHLAGSPVSRDALVDRLASPGLPSATIDALLARLAVREVLGCSKEGWSLPHDYAAMLGRQVEQFLDTYILGDPEGLDVLRQVLAERTGKSRRRPDRP
jgi:predicted transcriptional regulator